ncbi:MAG: carboxypeptidase M32 [Methanothrix sp.]|nr:carboxypeptidase M32 [Methanothrix sp.]
MRYNLLLIGFILTMTIFIITLAASCQMQGSADQNNNPDIAAREAYNRLLNTSVEMAYLDTMISLSQWDQDTSMPQNATGYRAKAQSYMEDLKNKMWIDPEFGRLLSIANNGSNWTMIEAANLRLWNRDYSKRIKLPPDFAARESEMASLAQAAWEDAREKNNYTIFQPHLKAMVELNKEKARYWGYKEHPYDALLDGFMPGMTVAKCDKLFDVIKPQIIELIVKINESHENGSKNIYGNVTYSEDKQEKFTRNITSALGYDYGSGIMIKTKRHPATYGIGSHDVRTSLKYDEHNPEDAILTAIHEGGHGIAAQKIPDEYYGMPIGIEPGMDTAEAESRLFENNIGRSRAFWEYWLPQLKTEFRPEMDNVSLDDMYRHVNRLNIGPIRIDADEISYMLHVIIRYEIERDLFDGKISVEDLPRIWHQKYKEYLGLNITDDKDGILQDVHWACGDFGYFPAYAMGSMNAAQMDAAMRRDRPDLDQRFASGDFSLPATWMQEHVYKYGAIYDTPELMKNATGNETEAYDFLNYLNSKYKKIYNLK